MLFGSLSKFHRGKRDEALELVLQVPRAIPDGIDLLKIPVRGVSLDIVDNIIPYIGGEEEKLEKEPRKVLGKVMGDRIVPDESIPDDSFCRAFRGHESEDFIRQFSYEYPSSSSRSSLIPK